MRGIQFIVDAEGRRKAAVVDLKEHGELWEDFYDAVVAAARQNEPRVAWEDVKRKAKKTPRRGANGD